MVRDLLNSDSHRQPAEPGSTWRAPVRTLGSAIISCSIISTTLATNVHAADPVDVAQNMIGRRYVWGAEGPTAFDCSGLVQYAFAQAGIDLPRRAVQQSEVGELARGGLRRGDLVFFATDRRQPRLVTHVGIYEAAGRMINASSRSRTVRRDDLADPYWEPRLLFATRLDADGEWPDRRAGVPDTRTRRSDPEPPARPAGTSRVLRRAAEEFARRILQRPRY
jgi:cell wall-associated NlpC family hydrolase